MCYGSHGPFSSMIYPKKTLWCSSSQTLSRIGDHQSVTTNHHSFNTLLLSPFKTMVDHHKWSGNGSCPYVKEPLWVPMIFPWMAWGQDRSPCEDHERPVAWRFFFRRWQFLLWMEEILHQLIDGLATFNCRGSTIQGGAGVLNHPQWWFVEYTNGIVIRIQQLTLTQNIKYIHSIVTLGYLTYIELIV